MSSWFCNAALLRCSAVALPTDSSRTGRERIDAALSSPSSFHRPRARLPGLADHVVVDVACGSNHSVAICTPRQSTHSPSCADHEVWVWGQGSDGQLGLGDSLDRFYPIRLKSLSSTRVTEVSAGGNHSLAVTCLGHVYGWGSNRCGQLGLPELGNALRPTLISGLQGTHFAPNVHHRCQPACALPVLPLWPRLIKCDFRTGKGIVGVAAGSSHSLFLGLSAGGEGLPRVYFAGPERRHPGTDQQSVPRASVTEGPKVIQLPKAAGVPRLLTCGFDQCAMLTQPSARNVSPADHQSVPCSACIAHHRQGKTESVAASLSFSSLSQPTLLGAQIGLLCAFASTEIVFINRLRTALRIGLLPLRNSACELVNLPLLAGSAHGTLLETARTPVAPRLTYRLCHGSPPSCPGATRRRVRKPARRPLGSLACVLQLRGNIGRRPCKGTALSRCKRVLGTRFRSERLNHWLVRVPSSPLSTSSWFHCFPTPP